MGVGDGVSADAGPGCGWAGAGSSAGAGACGGGGAACVRLARDPTESVVFAIFDVPVAGAYEIVVALAGWVSPGLTIVLFTVAVRLLLHPLARAAVKGEKARAILAPKMKELQKKYGKDRELMGRELAKLREETGVSMFAGCLPMLLQIPFFIVMFQLFSVSTVGAHPNGLLEETVFGAPLGSHWVAVPGEPVFLVLFGALAAVAWCSARLTRQTASQPTGQTAGQTAELPGAALLRLLPYGSVVAAAFLPLAAGVYLLTTTAWSTGERAYLRRRFLQ